MNLIGICGKIGDGKSTLAKFLIDKYGYKELAFAEPVKKIGMRIFGFLEKELYGTQTEKLDIDSFWEISGREFMQTLGEGIPELHPKLQDCWIRILKRYVIKNPGKYVISDVRKLTEVEMIRELGGKIVRVRRNMDRSGIEHSHVSESEVDLIQADYNLSDLDVYEGESLLEKIFEK